MRFSTVFTTHYAKAASTLLLFANLALFHAPALAQSSYQYIPFNADLVVSIDFQRIGNKVDLASLKQYAFFEELVRKSAEMSGIGEGEKMENFLEYYRSEYASLGYDLSVPMLFFVENEGPNTIMGLVVKMGDRAKYEAGLRRLVMGDFEKHLTDTLGVRLWQHHQETYAWNDEVVVNTWNTNNAAAYAPLPDYDYGMVPDETLPPDFTINYSDELVEETPVLPDSVVFIPENTEEESLSIEAPAEAIDWAEQPNDSVAARWALKLVRKDFLLPISRNEQFLRAMQTKSDARMWMDYSLFTDAMKTSQQAYGSLAGTEYAQIMSAMEGFMGVFYSDTYLSMGLDFENGKMVVNSELFFNEDMKRFYQKTLDVKFNKKFLRYVKGGDQLFGYYYLNLNVKNAIEEGKALMYKLFDATPSYGEAASDAMKILGIFIDEEAIGNLLKGDLMVSVSGMQEVEVKTQTYEYDEDFNYTVKDTVMLQTVPVFTALASYGSGKDIQKFIDLGLHSKVLEQQGAYYKFAIPNVGTELYLAKHDGMLIFTNNRYLVQQDLQKGVDKKLRLGKNHCKRLKEHSTVVFWDIPSTIKALAGDEANSNMGAMAELNEVGKEFHEMWMLTDKKPGEVVKGQYVFSFNNKNANSLLTFFNILNDVFLNQIGGARI